MKIGIDIDDTLVSTSESFDEVVKKYNLDFKKKFKDTWTEEEKKFIFDNYLKEILINAKLKENAKEVVNYLNNLGHKLVIITVRGNKYCDGIEEFTKKFIEQEKINICEFYFGEYEKSDLAKKLNLDLMIDDSVYIYNNMKKDNIECILFGDKIKTWKDVLDYIERKEKDDG